MSVACPCCKAANENGPNCRRCKADLSLLFQLASERAAQEQAVAALLAGDFAAALAAYQTASS